METEIHLVADTNLFFECGALAQLPWKELGKDKVVVLLTKPVLDEIDKHKKANGRTRARALEIFGRIRDMIANGISEWEISGAAPRVVLRRLTTAKPDPELQDDLDYGKTDEKLVGIASALAKTADGPEVRLFTNDTGPASIADDYRVPFLMIPQGWRRPPPETEDEKAVKELRKELADYRAQEPNMAIRLSDPDSMEPVTVVRKIASPLTPAEVEVFIEKLRAKHPIVEDFTPPEAVSSTDNDGVVTTVEYIRPSDEDVANYREKAYPAWIDRCLHVFKELHAGRDDMEQRLFLSWGILNNGSRPASQVRIEFEGRGPVKLRRLQDEEGGGEGDAQVGPARAELPKPPKAPAVERRVRRIIPEVAPTRREGLDLASIAVGGSRPLSNVERLAAMANPGGASNLARELARMSDPTGIRGFMKSFDPLESAAFGRQFDAALGLDRQRGFGISSVEPIARPFLDPSHFLVRPPADRNPETFYYDWPHDQDVKEGALTCELWRHHRAEEFFDFEVVFSSEGAARGIVECTVHAENLTRPAQAKVKVERVVESVSMLDLAEALIDQCG